MPKKQSTFDSLPELYTYAERLSEEMKCLTKHQVLIAENQLAADIHRRLARQYVRLLRMYLAGQEPKVTSS